MLRVLSTFSGISAASVAWKPLGFQFVAYSEIDSFACHVLSERLGVSRPKYLPSAETLGMTDRQYRTYVKSFDDLPLEGIPNFGDITQINDDDLRSIGHVDLLEGGTPCQSFSIAGLREGLNSERGNLMLEFCKLAERMKKINNLRFVLWENVKGVLSNDKGRAFGCLLGALSGASRPIQPPTKWANSGLSTYGQSTTLTWRVFDARFFGVRQRRERIFLIADFDDRRKLAEEILFNRRSKDRFASSFSKAGKEAVTGAVESSHRVNTEADFVHPKTVGTLLASGAGMSRTAGVGSELDFVIVQKLNGKTLVRRLHPTECERLQGFPDEWTNVKFKGKPAKDADRYRTIGNSMAVPCMKHIGIGLAEYAFAEQHNISQKFFA